MVSFNWSILITCILWVLTRSNNVHFTVRLSAPPKIGRNVPREVTGRVGEPFKIHIPFTGSPPDKVEVTKVN
ncbi:unnamed protein product [Schistosoma curassoni]|uniref:Secreted protein n=1 Tax=Schistosoma curassoni TaxID=6186 RepID=A0A183JQJ1_9TREM|nr:unnamed protein product [Schistosoma curassoni]